MELLLVGFVGFCLGNIFQICIRDIYNKVHNK